MKKNLVILICLMACLCTSAQTVYVYKVIKSSSDKSLALVAKTDSITITNLIRTTTLPIRRAVSNAGVYDFKFNASKNRDQILDSAGNVLAETKGFYDITLPDGTFYDHVNGEGETWNYLLNKKPVIKGEFLKVGDQRQIVVTWIDSNIQGKETVYLMTQIFGIERIRKIGSQTPFLVVGAVAGLVGLMVSLNQNDTGPR